MTGPQVSIVISPGAAAQRLTLSVASAVAAGEACGEPFEVIVALADADGPTREVAEALEHPRLRLSAASAADTRAAAELGWGDAVALLRGGDLFSPRYLVDLLPLLAGADGERVIARPAACVTYGGAPAMRRQASLGEGAVDRGRLLFAAPFAPPLAAARALLVRLPPRPWSVESDWAWTAQSVADGIRHAVAADAVYAAWSPSVAPPLSLPAIAEASPSANATPSTSEPASEAEVAMMLYARAAHARLGGIEEAVTHNDRRLGQLGKDAAHLRGALAHALQAADDARRTADSLKASTSWKITAPLRALVSRMKPGGGR